MEVNEMTKKCPYCDEEIAIAAKKCKHCGEWLEEKQLAAEEIETKEKKEEEVLGFGGRIRDFLIFAGIGWVLFHFGSWHLVLGTKISIWSKIWQFLDNQSFDNPSFILDANNFLFRINSKYYGLGNDGRFFDSPVLQWIMLLFALSAFFCAIKTLISGSFMDG